MLGSDELPGDNVEEMGGAIQTFLRSQASHEEPAIVRIEGDRSRPNGNGVPERRWYLPGRLPTGSATSRRGAPWPPADPFQRPARQPCGEGSLKTP